MVQKETDIFGLDIYPFTVVENPPYKDDPFFY